MKQLRSGFTTGSCAAAAALASVLWQKNGSCPQYVEIETPAGVLFHPKIVPLTFGVCGVQKDGGDDPDVTDGCMVYASVRILETDGAVTFLAGEGVGTVTRKGLKIPVGEPAINPVPRQMIKKAIQTVIGSVGAEVSVFIPGGAKLAERTFNSRLGITGGLSILGTTGIVRPMSEEAVRESLRLELSMYRAETGTTCAFITGYIGERFLKRLPHCGSILLCSNYLGYLLDCAAEMGFTHILLAGGTGKLIKPAANIMYLHSHTAGGQREIICTHAALCGADRQQIQQLYHAATTLRAANLLKQFGLAKPVWQSIAESAAENCVQRVHGKLQVGILLLDAEENILAQTENCDAILSKWRNSHA